ncbi:MAG: hypothetical protein HY532_06755, partial [Chloroflexi bacterium]|nr:hypothetical protein [Chloroflexota bacterium]
TKEMEALQNEVKGLQEQARRIEDEEVLGLMMRLEGEEAWVEKATVDLAALERERLGLVEQLTAEQARMERLLPALKTKRQEWVRGFPTALLSQYERLRSLKQGQALARVERGMCSGCRVALPAREMQHARAAREQPALCPSCGRMLYAG